jgi:queuosine precursor transporter
MSNLQVPAMQDSPGPKITMSGRARYFLVLMTVHSSLLVASTAAGAKPLSLPFGLDAGAEVFSYLLTS